ncbi:MAG: aminodeoxychorismate/anthranilate synthase component II [Pseudomonadota bacterium]
MILLVDNYDSFVYNLSRYAGQLGKRRLVVRNDAVSLVEIIRDPPRAIILSPGPCTPAEAGVCLPLIREFHQAIPILGVCLGHQCIGEAFGGRTVRAEKPVHGKASLIDHNGEGLFQGLPQLFRGGRYHSLVTELPADAPLEVTARVQGQGTIMAMRHKRYPVFGLQFHPESVLTEHGLDLLRNFFTIADEWNAKRRRTA